MEFHPWYHFQVKESKSKVFIVSFRIFTPEAKSDFRKDLFGSSIFL